MNARLERQAPGGGRATVADLLLLERVSRVAGAFSTRHAERFMERSRAVVRRRLRRLYDLGLLEVHLERDGLVRPNWYSLTRMGAQRLARIFDREVEEYMVRRGLPRQLDHHGAIVDHLVDIEVASARSNEVDLVRVTIPAEKRDRGAVVPDLVADVEVGTRRSRLLFEVDQGTESPHVVALKVRAYADLLHAAGATHAVLFTVPSVRRRNRLILRFAEEALPAAGIFIACQADITSRTILTRKLWRCIAADADGVVRARLADPLNRDLEGCSP